MGYEFIHEDAITPQRILSILCLVKKSSPMPRHVLFELLQPASVLENKDAADRNYRAMKRFGLIIEDEGRERIVRLGVPPKLVESLAAYRRYFASMVLGIIDDNRDFFLLNQFAAWYAVQNEQVFQFSRMDIEAKFNDQLYPGAENRAFRERSNFNAWRTWAEFLGWGWNFTLDSRHDIFVPDATMRVRALLNDLLPQTAITPLSEFITSLRRLCPELDGGILFERCWQSSRGNEIRGNRLSLMLSTALRVMDKAGDLELIHQKDAEENWTLFPAQSYLNQVTHIRRKTAA